MRSFDAMNFTVARANTNEIVFWQVSETNTATETQDTHWKWDERRRCVRQMRTAADGGKNQRRDEKFFLHFDGNEFIIFHCLALVAALVACIVYLLAPQRVCACDCLCVCVLCSESHSIRTIHALEIYFSHFFSRIFCLLHLLLALIKTHQTES